METDLKQDAQKKSQGRILFTGTGERMIDNVMEFIPPAYEISRCQPIDTEFYRAVKKSCPHAVVICLQSETREQLRVYDTLYADEAYAEFPVLVIGYEDDCTQFRSRLPMKNLKIFGRPVNRDALLQELEQCVSQAQELELKKREPKPDVSPKSAVATNGDTRNLVTLDESEMRESEKDLVQKIKRGVRLYGRKSVLVVDDDVTMLNVIKFYLQDLYDVTVVPSGKLALKYIEKKQTDLVLLDYMMPMMDGPEVLQRIRQESTQKNVPVLFLTGVSDKELVMRGLEFRPNGYLLKPVSREALLEKVTEIALKL